MKKTKIIAKLTLNKQTIANLNNSLMARILGGGATRPPSEDATDDNPVTTLFSNRDCLRTKIDCP